MYNVCTPLTNCSSLSLGIPVTNNSLTVTVCATSLDGSTYSRGYSIGTKARRCFKSFFRISSNDCVSYINKNEYCTIIVLLNNWSLYLGSMVISMLFRPLL